MKRLVTLASLAACIGIVTFAAGQTTKPTDAERLAATAKEFGMTPEQLDRFVRTELGDPIIVDGDLIVSIHRDDAGHVTAVSITTPQRSVAFNRQPDEKHPGLRYNDALPDKPNELSNADDLDGDGRLDMLLMPQPNAATAAILLRIGARFEPATALGERRFRVTTNGDEVRFDFARREWVLDKR